MNRIATTLTTLTASALIFQTANAADVTIETLDSRMKAMESRLVTIEEILHKKSPGYSYDAMNDATNEGLTQNLSSGTETSNPVSGETYVIQDGDTLGSIARKHGVERASLLTANRLSEGQPIYIGETLMIPGTMKPDTQNVAKTEPEVAPEKKVDVAKNDTKKAPEKKTSSPEKPKVHVVAKGDTLMGLSRKYNTSVANIKSANGLRSDVISLGQKITIPSAKSMADAGGTKDSGKKQDASYEYDNPLLRNSETYGYYTVRKGDNLYALARDFFTTMSELQRVNKLGGNTLIYPGNELIVPTSKYNAYHKTGDVASR